MMGRPKKAAKDRRSKQVAIRFTPRQSRKLERLARSVNMSVSELLRKGLSHILSLGQGKD